MVKKSVKTIKRKRVGKIVTSLLAVSILFAGMALPAAAETVSNEASQAEPLLSFWSDLVDRFVCSASDSVSAYYSADSGFTILGILLCTLFAATVFVALICWLLKLLRFSH